MSNDFRPPQGPPWDIDDVADVHAGLFPVDVTADLLALIKSDPDGAAILHALDSTVDDLSLLPPLLMPAKYVLRLDAALLAEQRSAHATRPIARARLGALLAPGAGGAAPRNFPAPLPHRPSLPSPRPQPPTTIPVPARHHPVIPAVLPGAVFAPAAVQRQPMAPVADLNAAREHAATPANSPPAEPGTSTGPTSTGSTSSGPSGPARIGSLEAQRRKRRRWTTGILAAAAVAGIGVIAVVALNQPSSIGVAGGANPGAPAPTSIDEPGAVGATNGNSSAKLDLNNLGQAVPSIEGKRPAGVLSNLGLYDSCLRLNSIVSNDVNGATEVTFDGQQAIAIVVKNTADPARVRVVVVGTGCGADNNAATLADKTVTR